MGAGGLAGYETRKVKEGEVPGHPRQPRAGLGSRYFNGALGAGGTRINTFEVRRLDKWFPGEGRSGDVARVGTAWGWSAWKGVCGGGEVLTDR